MKVQYLSNRLSRTDYIVIVLSSLYMVHNSPYVGVRMPAIFFASVIVLLFLLICINLARYQNIVRSLMPLFSLYFLDIIFLQHYEINSVEGAMRLLSSTMQILISRQ